MPVPDEAHENDFGHIQDHNDMAEALVDHEARLSAIRNYVPTGGDTNQVLTKVSATNGDTMWADPASGEGGVTDHGALTGLNDPDHIIASVSGLQAALDGKSATHAHPYDATGTAAAAVATHAALPDPHPGYLTPAEGNAAYDATGAATAAVVAHVALGDPHTQYLTESAAAAGYDVTGAAAAAVASHVAAGDPHTQYLTESAAATSYAVTTRGIPTGGSSAQVLSKVSGTNYDVTWTTPSAGGITPPTSIVGTDAATVPLAVTGAAAQSANILNAKLTDGTVVLGVNSTGEVKVGPGGNPAATLKVTNTDATRKLMVIRMATSQTANAIEVQSQPGDVLFSVDENGTVFGLNISEKPTIVLDAADPVPVGTLTGTIILRRP